MNVREINTRTSTRKRYIFLSLVLVLMLCFTNVNIRETSISKEHNTQSTLRRRIFHFFVLISRVLTYFPYTCAYFTSVSQALRSAFDQKHVERVEKWGCG